MCSLCECRWLRQNVALNSIYEFGSFSCRLSDHCKLPFNSDQSASLGPILANTVWYMMGDKRKPRHQQMLLHLFYTQYQVVNIFAKQYAKEWMVHKFLAHKHTQENNLKKDISGKRIDQVKANGMLIGILLCNARSIFTWIFVPVN